MDSSYTNTYVYNSSGERTHKRRTSLETVYVSPYYVIRNLLFQTKHIYAGPTRIVSAVVTLNDYKKLTTNQTPILFYYHSDQLGSTGYITDRTGQILEHEEYLPGGESWFEELKNSSANNRLPWQFNGKELDETGLYYCGARYYNPRAGVWMSADPVLAQYVHGEINSGVFHPQNLGLYGYTWNNPVRLIDANGLDPSDAWYVRIGKVAVGIAYGTVQAAAPGGFILDTVATPSKDVDFLAGKGAANAATGAVEVLEAGQPPGLESSVSYRPAGRAQSWSPAGLPSPPTVLRTSPPVSTPSPSPSRGGADLEDLLRAPRLHRKARRRKTP